MQPSRSGQSASNSVSGSIYALIDDLSKMVIEGRGGDVEALLAAHPEHAARLRELIPALELLGDVSKSSDRGADKDTDFSAIARTIAEHESGVLGDFRIQREIGRGGMGVVFEATQISLGRRIALKVLPFGAILSGHQLQRFKNEARAAAGLQHPNIVPVYAVGCERGIHFYAMQFIEGSSLADVIHEARQGRSRMSSRIICDWVIQVAEALDYAHSVGVIHRDIKPANLLVEPNGTAWVTDFGLAQFESEAALTMAGDVLGTLKYMSPEQAKGENGLVNQQSDIYSLGATLYELATLQPLFSELVPIDLMRQIQDVEPTSPRRINPKISVELETIILKAVDKEPNRRYKSAHEFAEDVRRFLSHRPIFAKRAGLWDRISKWRRRNVAFAQALTAFVLLSCISLALAGYFVQRNQQLAVESLARSAERQRNLHRYVTNINLAERAWRGGNYQELQNYLSQCVPMPGEVDFRSFEWHYLSLRQRITSDRTLIGKHDKEAYFVRVAPDKKSFATCGVDGIRIWKLPSYEPLMHFQPHTDEVNCVSYSPDGKHLISSGDDGLAIITSTDDWKEVRKIPHEGAVVAAHFLSDGGAVVTAERWSAHRPNPASTNQVRIWDQRTGELIRECQRHERDIESLVVSPDGRLVASSSRDGVALIWDLKQNKIVHRIVHREIPGDKGTSGQEIRAVAFSDLKPWFATAAVSGVVRVWSLEDFQLVTELVGSTITLDSVAFDPQSLDLTAGGQQRTLFTWSLGAHYRPIPLSTIGTEGHVWCLTYVDDTTILTTDRNGQVYRYDTRKPGEKQVIPIANGRWPRIAVASNESFVASVDSKIVAYDIRSGQQTSEVAVPKWDSDSYMKLAASRSRGLLARLTPDRTLRLYSWPDHRLLRETTINATNFADELSRMKFVSNDELIEIYLPEGTCHYDVSTLQPVELIAGPRQGERVMASSRKGVWVVVRADSSLEGWIDGKVAWRADMPSSSLKHLLSETGDRLATAHNVGRVTVRNSATGNIEAELISDGELREIAFSPDGKTLAGLTHGGGVQLWNLATGRELYRLSHDTGSPIDLHFTPDGMKLLLCGKRSNENDEVVVWSGRE